MTRKKPNSSNGRLRRDRIREAALTLFYERSYHAASIRQVTARAGIDPAGFYYYFPSKQALLASILEEVMTELIDEVEGAVAAAGPSPEEQLRRAISANVLFHGRHPREGFVSDSELRGLDRRNRTRVIALRDRHERIFREILQRGNADGTWSTDIRLAGFIVLATASEVCGWYRPDGPLSLEEIADFFAAFAIGGLGAGKPAGDRRIQRPSRAGRSA
jgi:AcrR family transcriptional regulator